MTVRVGCPGQDTSIAGVLVVCAVSRRTAREKLPASATRWNPTTSAPSRPSTIWVRHGSWAKMP